MDDSSKAPLIGFVALWAVIPAVETYLALGLPNPLHPTVVLLEWVAFPMAGWAQWRFAKGSARSALLPLWVVVVGLCIEIGPDDLFATSFYLFGVGFALVKLTRWLSSRGRLPLWVGALLVGGSLFGERVLRVQNTLAGLSVDELPTQLAWDLAWPMRPAPDAPSGTDGPPLVVISVDTLRSDSAQTMASYRRLADRGLAWPRAMSASSWTLPAVASLQTGLMPASHGAGCLPGGHCQGMGSDVRTVASDLAAAGYQTAGFVSNNWLSASTGFARGFHTYQDYSQEPVGFRVLRLEPQPYARAEVVVDAAIAWLEEDASDSFYLWVHLFDPHMPYLAGPDWIPTELTGPDVRNIGVADPSFHAGLRTAYEQEVAYADQHIVRLLDVLEREGILDRGVVVLTSDHGEEFWEHNSFEHGHSHHTEVVDIPLVVSAPGLSPGTPQTMASIVDVAATLRAAAGTPSGPGTDLRAPIDPLRVVRAWGNYYRRNDCSSRSVQHRVINLSCTSEGDVLRYDTHEDRWEHVPLPFREGDPMVSAVRDMDAPAPGAEAAVNRAALEALGYIE
jgi:hypothetical protein